MTKYNKSELENLIINENLSYEAIGRIYDVSGNAIKKAAKRLGIELPKRRVINECEDFVKKDCKRSILDKITDDDFINIIKDNIGWKNIGIALGYSDVPNSNIKNKIIERCQRLNITLNIRSQIKVISPVLLKTKKELLTERKNYQSYRSGIRKLAERIYKESGKALSCKICGYNKHVEIAHIKAVSDFDDSTTIAEINDINNLVALCPNHHWEYDNGYIKL